MTCIALSKTYATATGEIEALRAVDVSVARGEVAAIVGPSGSGKSTLLRLLAGLDRPTEGKLLLRRDDFATASPSKLRRHRRECVTFISQKASDNFVPHLTLREHARDAPTLALRLLMEVGLGDRLDSKPLELSGGEQARAAFALALARETPLVVVDEPTAELDRASTPAVLEIIRRHAGSGTAFVVATHDEDVTASADRILRLDRGRVVSGQERPATVAQPGLGGLEAAGTVLEARSLRKTYRRGREAVHAVADASITLRGGEVSVVIGRSGSGKSTLLTLLAGWQRPDAGTILWSGAAVNPAALPWSRLSYVPQRFGLIPELSVRENVELPVRLSHANVNAADRVDELLERLGLTELASRLPSETSIGQQQRTALARALVLRPALLLADEPTSHQDAGWRDAVWEQLLLAGAEGTACLAATHEERAAGYASQLWEIAEGVVSLRRR